MDIYAHSFMERPYSLICYYGDGHLIVRLNWSPEDSGRVTETTTLSALTAAQDDAWHEAHRLLYANHLPQRHQTVRQLLEGVFARVEVVTQ